MSNKRRILFVRHAQRLDRYVKQAYPALKSWTNECFSHSQYRPLNIEFPANLPSLLRNDTYIDDTSLTTMGEGCAQILSNRLAEIGLLINHVYSSPSLRCVQTGFRILEGYTDLNGPHDLDLKMRLEGGLYEFGSFCSSVPTFIEPKFLSDRGLLIDLTYKSQIKRDELLLNAFETYAEFRDRAKICIDNILRTVGPTETIMIVTHAPTLLTFVRNLLKKPISEDYLSIKCIENILRMIGPSAETIMIVTHAPTLLTFVRELMKKSLSEENLEQYATPGNILNKPAYIATVMLEENLVTGQWILPLPQPVPSFEIRAHTSFSQSWLDKQMYDSLVV